MVETPLRRTFNYSLVEALLKGHNIKDDDPAMVQVARICSYSAHRLPPKEVSAEAYNELLNWMAAYFYPDLPQSEALFEVGSHFFEGYRTTILGRVQLAAIHIMGPDRLTQRYVEMTNRNSNFGERTVTQLGVHNYLIRYRGVPLPGDYLIGVMKSGLAAAGLANPKLSWEQLGPEDTDFRVSW